MKNQEKSINEEIERIKSLFTEERMFGNLVEKKEEKEIDPFSKKGARKSKKLQKRKNKDLDKDIKDQNKLSSKELKSFKEFCSKQMNIINNVFIVKQNSLDMGFKKGDTKTWDELLKERKVSYENNDGETKKYSYKDLFTKCSKFTGEELKLKSFGGKSSDDIKKILTNIVNTSLPIDGRMNSYKNIEGGVKEKVKDITGVDKIKKKFKKLKVVVKNQDGFDAGELILVDANKYMIDPEGSFTPVDKSKGKNNIKSFTFYPEFRDGIDKGVEQLYTMAKKEKLNPLPPLTSKNKTVEFTDKKTFLVK